jgi:hypothetical protein
MEKSTMKYRARIVLGLACLVLTWDAPVEANPILSFDQPSYTIGIGQTVKVAVLVSQNSTGTQIGTSNPLISAGVALSFNNGVAAVTTITPISTAIFDFSSSSTVPSTLGTASLQENVFLTGTGISSVSPPALLGMFTFTGLAYGSTQITLGPITPGNSFGTPNGAFTPAQVGTATATLNVVPEPTSLIVMLTGAPVLLGVVALRSRRLVAARKTAQ